jgi:methylaspartate mutase sigma subunit
MDNKTLVLGVIGADVHAIGNKILEHSFSKAGFKVVNLGVMVSQEEFIEAALNSNAEAILIGSLYGHGEIDCRGLRDKCMQAGIGDIFLYVGGNLVVGKQDWSKVKSKFAEMGFDRVYPPGTLPDDVLADLDRDLLS